MKTSSFDFEDDGDIPNHPRYQLIVYRRAVDPTAGPAATAFEDLFRAHGWGRSWHNGIFPFHHYHSNAHEVLGIAAGEAEIRFGGEAGTTMTVTTGDAVLIPAGVGHKRLSSDPDLLVIGAYPPGAPVDLFREGAEEGEAIRHRIAEIAKPAADPVVGRGGPMNAHWPD